MASDVSDEALVAEVDLLLNEWSARITRTDLILFAKRIRDLTAARCIVRCAIVERNQENDLGAANSGGAGECMRALAALFPSATASATTEEESDGEG